MLVLTATLCCLILCETTTLVKRSTKYKDQCNFSNPCISLCCTNCSLSFNIKDVPAAKHFPQTFKIIEGNPCESFGSQEDDYDEDESDFGIMNESKWSLKPVRRFNTFAEDFL